MPSVKMLKKTSHLLPLANAGNGVSQIANNTVICITGQSVQFVVLKDQLCIKVVKTRRLLNLKTHRT